MWARNGASLTWPRTLVLALGLTALSPGAQESLPVDESPEQRLRDAREQSARLDFASAKTSLEAAVQLIERESGATSGELIAPLTALGDVQIAMGEQDGAAMTLRRAVTIVRRSEGLYAHTQYPLLMSLVEIDSGAGRLAAARSSLRQLQRVSAGLQESDWQTHARAQAEIADWQCRIGEFVEGRRLYRTALHSIASRDDGPLQADTLVGYARCCLMELSAQGVATTPGSFERYRGPVQRTDRMSPINPAFRNHLGRMLRWEGEQALRRAALIAESGRLDPQRSLEVMLQAGDWFQTKDHYRAARTYYARAEEIALRSSADAPLASPVQILYPLPAAVLRARGSMQAQAQEPGRYVEIEFRVLANGSVDGERVINRELGKSTVDEVLNSLTAARYRPRFEAGRAVATDGVRLRQPIPELR